VGASVAVDGTGLLEVSAAGDHGIDGREMLFRDIVLLFGFGGRSFGTTMISTMRSVVGKENVHTWRRGCIVVKTDVIQI